MIFKSSHLDSAKYNTTTLAHATSNEIIYFSGILEEERKEKKHQADESAKQIKLLQGTSVCVCVFKNQTFCHAS